MATIRPFSALRPVPEKAKEVSSVPYDVVDTQEARLLTEENPLSFLHVIRPEIDLPVGTGLYEDSVSEQAVKNLEKLTNAGVLVKEKEPKLYIYRIIMGDHEQTGIAACCSVDEYDNDTIKKHEHTRKEKEDDRLRHMLSLSAHAGPVLMTYDGLDAINAIVDFEVKRKPVYDFIAEDGIRHTVWIVDDYKGLVDAFIEVPCIYIADGHHRAAGASRVRKEKVKLHGNRNALEEYNFFLSVLFPKQQLKIEPYNRYVSDLNGLSEDEFLRRVGDLFDVKKGTGARPSQKGYFGMYLIGSWYELHARTVTDVSQDAVESLDLSIFQKMLIEPVLGITDQKSDKRIDFIGGSESIPKLKRQVDEDGGVAFSFYPVTIDELLAVADAGMIMPPKSTWFAPKLRSGLLIHQF